MAVARDATDTSALPRAPGDAGEPIVLLRDVHQAFGSLEVLKGISFSVRKGGVACIIGPSGSGKSTLLRCINGLVPIRSGTIRVADFDVLLRLQHTHGGQRVVRSVVVLQDDGDEGGCPRWHGCD